MSDPGGATTVQYVVKGATTFTIVLTAAAVSHCQVAWFVVA